MKKLLIIPLLLFSSLAQAGDDCEHCFWWDWSRWFPIIEMSEWPVEFIKVEKEEYPRNEKASYCTRPVEMLDTIVIHHSAGSPQSTPKEINAYHMTRGTAADPWYMIGYSYVINSPYPGAKVPEPKVTEGRPIDIVGSHAGTDAFVKMSEEQKKLWDEGKVVCGKTGEEFKVDPKLVKKDKIKANVTTLGLVVLGNYAPFSKWNPTGFIGKVRYPTQETLEMTAKMACQIQKRWPGIKKITWHHMYTATSCPGTVRQKIEEIKKLAKGYGCEFK